MVLSCSKYKSITIVNQMWIIWNKNLNRNIHWAIKLDNTFNEKCSYTLYVNKYKILFTEKIWCVLARSRIFVRELKPLTRSLQYERYATRSL